MFWCDDPEWETGNLLFIWHQSKHVRVVIETISECGLRYAQTSLIWEQQVSKWSSLRDVMLLILCLKPESDLYKSNLLHNDQCVFAWIHLIAPRYTWPHIKKTSILIMVTSSVGGVCVLLDLTLALWPVQTSNQKHATPTVCGSVWVSFLFVSSCFAVTCTVYLKRWHLASCALPGRSTTTHLFLKTDLEMMLLLKTWHKNTRTAPKTASKEQMQKSYSHAHTGRYETNKDSTHKIHKTYMSAWLDSPKRFPCRSMHPICAAAEMLPGWTEVSLSFTHSLLLHYDLMVLFCQQQTVKHNEVIPLLASLQSIYV